ncbi:MAG: hypothetical protein IKM62_00045 [Kiritimatiellae bacterium]|nr:hypothetical protein [Kiritimatiellia bacterium]
MLSCGGWRGVFPEGSFPEAEGVGLFCRAEGIWTSPMLRGNVGEVCAQLRRSCCATWAMFSGEVWRDGPGVWRWAARCKNDTRRGKVSVPRVCALEAIIR